MNGAGCVASTVAVSCLVRGFGWFVVLFEYCFVVSCDKASHVFVAAVAHTYGVSVEESVEFVVLREVFVD